MGSQARNEASRRDLLVSAIAAAASVLGTARVRAQTKASKAEAQYQPGPKGGQICAMCQLFCQPHACQVVEGDILPQGWCKFFTIPD